MVKMVFCSYPIDQVQASMVHFYELVALAQSTMLSSGEVDVVFDPGDAFKVARGATPTRSIDWINRRALYEADGMMAFLPAGVPTIGVPTEIERARAAGKPVAILSDAKSWMLTPTQRVQIFSLDDSGVAEASDWLAAQEAMPPARTGPDPLPVLVAREGSLPTRGYADDAGLDLVVSKDSVVLPGCSVDVPCGVAVELPPGTWGLIIGRSSTRRTRGLLVHPGVIDVGWRGELFVCVENQTIEPVRVQNNPLFPTSGPATSSFNGLHLKSNFLAITRASGSEFHQSRSARTLVYSMKIYYCLISAFASLIFLDGRCDAQEKGTIPLSELARKVFEEKRVDLAEATARPVEVELNALREECLERLANGQEPQKRVAARLLGVLRSEKAIDLLIANITLANPLQTGSGVPGIEGIQDYPACAALLYIRGPNVIAAVRKARANTAEGSLERRLFDPKRENGKLARARQVT